MKLKTIKIEEDAFEKLKIYCNKNGLKIYKFISNVMMEKIDELNKKMPKV